MSEEKPKYYLHRITGGANARPYAIHLLGKENEEKYLSIGWCDFSEDAFVQDVLARDIEAVNEWLTHEGYTPLSPSRWCLWRFIKQMQPGDYVLVPSWGTFSVYKILDDKVYTNQSLPIEKLRTSGSSYPIYDGKYLRDEKGNYIDLGFYRKVEKVEIDIPRSLYAKKRLISRMKIRQTNADITDIKELVNEAIVAYSLEKPVNLKENILNDIVEKTFYQIKETLDANKFEDLVRWYLESLGAAWVDTPPKNASSTKEGDADKVAYFEKLKLIVMVQAKRHEDITKEWAVQQITNYRDNNKTPDEYTSILWVISTGDDFSPEAKQLAEDNGVRLINGLEFTKLILDSGLYGMDI